MARIAGVDLPRDKRVEIGLTYILGIGLSSSQKILAKTGVNPDTRVRDLTEDEVQKIREVIGSEYKVEDVVITKTICMEHFKNTVGVYYKIKNGSKHSKLILAPVMNFRNSHGINKDHIFNIKQNK